MGLLFDLLDNPYVPWVVGLGALFFGYRFLADHLKIPLRFVGVGETAEDFGVFDAETFVDAVLAPPRSGVQAE